MLGYLCFLTVVNGSISKIHIFLSPCVHFPATRNKQVTRTMDKNVCYCPIVYIYIIKVDTI